MEKKQVIKIAFAAVILVVAIVLIAKTLMGGSDSSDGPPSVSMDPPASTILST